MEGASRACETRKEARLSRRRHSCTGGRPWVRNESGASQTRYRSDFKRTWVRLGERGRRDRLGARRGESLFSLNWKRKKGHLSPSFFLFGFRQIFPVRK